MKRIFVSELFHEGHSFSALRTGRDSFTVTSGADLIEKARESGSILGGAVRQLEQCGAEIHPGLSAVAAPGGPVCDAAFEELSEAIAEAAVKAAPDAVFLGLHGAMLTDTLTDPEGALLQMLRDGLGPDVPIAIALDLHAHPTPAMLACAPICVACKENPHTDYDKAGAIAARLLIKALDGEIRPVTAAVWVPLVIGARMDTGDGPLAELHRLRREIAARAGLLDISIFNTTAYLDAPGAGQCILTIADGDGEAAAAAAQRLAEEMWACRDSFTPDRPGLLDALQAHETSADSHRPLVIGDQGDRVLAGAPGDDPGVIAEFCAERPAMKVLAAITDPEAVAQAVASGIGATFEYPLGAAYSATARPLKRNWRVLALGDGRFTQKGPMLAGEPSDMGSVAVLESGGATVVASSRPAFSQDVNAFLHLGLRLEDFNAIVVKSGFHFRLSFADVGPCVVVDTAGLTNYAPGRFPYAFRCPVYPEDDVAFDGAQASLFRLSQKENIDGNC